MDICSKTLKVTLFKGAVRCHKTSANMYSHMIQGLTSMHFF